MTQPLGRLLLMPEHARLRRRRTAADLDERAAARRDPRRRRPAALGGARTPKTTRAFLKRVDAVAPLAQPLQEMLDRRAAAAAQGRARDPAAGRPSGVGMPLLAPALRRPRPRPALARPACRRVADPGARAGRRGARRWASPVVAARAAPSSIALALAASGLNGQSFAFVGYLPVDADRARARASASSRRRRGAMQQTQVADRDAVPQRRAARGAARATLQPTTRLSVSGGLTLPGGWTRSDSVAELARSGRRRCPPTCRRCSPCSLAR